MNKYFNIAVSIAVSAFLATNFYLLFSDKSIITKSVYVNEYERLPAKDYQENLTKQAFVAPLETYTVYLEEEEAVNSWLVEEGDVVTVGQELALLNTERAEGERELWEAEYEALLEQEIDLNQMISDLESARSKAKSNQTSNVKHNDGVKEIQGKTTIEIGVDVGFTVDVTEEGSYSQAIAAVEQQLAEVNRQLVVLDAQLMQDPSNPALISPAEGVVSNVTRHSDRLFIDIYSEQKVLVTYIKDDEWQEVEEGQQVNIHGTGIVETTEGTVLSVSTVAANPSDLLATYKELDIEAAENPLAYYEVRILPDEELVSVHFAKNAETVITTDEAFGAVAINELWLYPIDEDTREAAILDEAGRAKIVKATTPFTLEEYAIVTAGVAPKDVVLGKLSLREYDYAPHVILQFPSELPKKKEWKAFGWRNYVKAMFVK